MLTTFEAVIYKSTELYVNEDTTTNFKPLDMQYTSNEISANNPNKNEQVTLLQKIYVSDEIITEIERATRVQATLFA